MVDKKDCQFNQLVKQNKYLQHKKIAETFQNLNTIPINDDQVVDEIKKVMRDTSQDYTLIKKKLAKYELDLTQKAATERNQ